MTSRMKTRVLAILAAAGLSCAGAFAQNVTGAGATFPYPMYSKWFDEYHKKFPNITFNYQSIGSGGGIQQVTVGTVDFGASDGPMNDKQIADFKAKRGSDILHFPTVMGADVPVYNIPGVTAQLNFTPEALCGDLPREDHKMERSGDYGSQPRRKTAERPHRRGAPLRWERYDVLLDRLSFQNQQGMGDQSRSRHFCKLAGGTRRQGE